MIFTTPSNLKNFFLLLLRISKITVIQYQHEYPVKAQRPSKFAQVPEEHASLVARNGHNSKLLLHRTRVLRSSPVLSPQCFIELQPPPLSLCIAVSWTAWKTCRTLCEIIPTFVFQSVIVPASYHISKRITLFIRGNPQVVVGQVSGAWFTRACFSPRTLCAFKAGERAALKHPRSSVFLILKTATNNILLLQR